MSLTIYNQKLDPEEEKQISAFVTLHPQATVFQSPVFYHFYLEHEKGFSPYYFVFRKDDQTIEAVMLAVIISQWKGWLTALSSRCVVYGGPLVNNDNPNILHTILSTLNQRLKHKAVFTQFRNFRQWDEPQIRIFERQGFVMRPRLNLIIHLDTEEAVKARFSPSRRRQLKNALAQDISVRPATDLNEVRKLYWLLAQLYREKVRKPLPNQEYFDAFFEKLVPRGYGIILVVLYQSDIIGGIVCPITPGQTISELYVCGMDRRFPKLYPSTVATWAAMAYGLKHKIQYFDFMGLGKPDQPYGVRDFKLRFGGQQINPGRFARRNNKFIYLLAETGYNLLRSLKKI